MRYNRWVRTEAKRDIDRVCANHPESADLIRKLADWIIDQLAVDPGKKGETLESPDGKLTYARWSVGPVTVVFTLLPGPDRTVIVDGFTLNP
jgi:hypothetical protein